MKKDNGIGRNNPGGNFPGGTLMGENFPGEIFPQVGDFPRTISIISEFISS